MRSNDLTGSAALKKIIEVMEMEANQDWMVKYMTEEGRDKIEAWKQRWSPELSGTRQQAME